MTNIPVICVEEHIAGISFVFFVTAKTKVAHKAVGVSACKRLSVGRPCTIEHGAMTLSVDLKQCH